MKNVDINNEKDDINLEDPLKEEEIKEDTDQEKINEESSQSLDLEEKEKEISEIKDKFVRLQADFANYKRRTENERIDYLELGKLKIVEDLIPVIDNFERALEFKVEDKNFLKGFELIYKQLIELLDKNDVSEINSLNEKFDPNLHHAVLVEEKVGVEEGIVIEVLQKGYTIGDRVIRPTMVKVSK